LIRAIRKSGEGKQRSQIWSRNCV